MPRAARVDQSEPELLTYRLHWAVRHRPPLDFGMNCNKLQLECFDTFYNASLDLRASPRVVSPHAGAKHARAGCETNVTLQSGLFHRLFSDVGLLCLGLDAEQPEASSRAGALQRALMLEKSLIWCIRDT